MRSQGSYIPTVCHYHLIQAITCTRTERIIRPVWYSTPDAHPVFILTFRITTILTHSSPLPFNVSQLLRQPSVFPDLTLVRQVFTLFQCFPHLVNSFIHLTQLYSFRSKSVMRRVEPSHHSAHVRQLHRHLQKLSQQLIHLHSPS